jgi:hypothetical protein
MIWHLTSYWCILTLDFILMYFDNWLYINVFRWIPVLLMYTFVFLLYNVYFLLYTMYFCCIFKKKNRKHICGAPFLMSVAHPIRGAPKRGAPQTLCVAHVIGYATDITPINGAHRRAPQIKVTCGFICVAHARYATKLQNDALQIGFLLVVRLRGYGPT